jgi:hypothetical protein
MSGHARLALPPEKKPGTHCTGGLVDNPRPVWTDAKNFSPAGIQSPDRPARCMSQVAVTLYIMETETFIPTPTQLSVTPDIILIRTCIHIYSAFSNTRSNPHTNMHTHIYSAFSNTGYNPHEPAYTHLLSLQ